MDVLGIACITNIATGMQKGNVLIKEFLETAKGLS